jgi:hypothetical protein
MGTPPFAATMSDPNNLSRSLRDRLGGEDRLGRALSELLENPLLTGAIGRAFEAREKASQAQEVALGALNLPSAADIERLTRRLRGVSNRLEGIEDGLDRLDRALAPSGVEARLSAIEAQLRAITSRLEVALDRPAAGAKAGAATDSAEKPRPAARRSPAKRSPAKRSGAKRSGVASTRARKPARKTTPRAAKGG